MGTKRSSAFTINATGESAKEVLKLLDDLDSITSLGHAIASVERLVAQLMPSQAVDLWCLDEAKRRAVRLGGHGTLGIDKDSTVSLDEPWIQWAVGAEFDGAPPFAFDHLRVLRIPTAELGTVLLISEATEHYSRIEDTLRGQIVVMESSKAAIFP